jgi:hypothetical protein
MAGHFLAKPFNFFVSPVVDPMFGFDRSFLCQASAIDMLCKGKLDFNHLFRYGIRYLSRQEERNVRKSEVDRVEGNRELAIIDEGGQKFLDQVKSSNPQTYLCNWALTRMQGDYPNMARRSLRGKIQLCQHPSLILLLQTSPPPIAPVHVPRSHDRLVQAHLSPNYLQNPRRRGSTQASPSREIRGPGCRGSGASKGVGMLGGDSECFGGT